MVTMRVYEISASAGKSSQRAGMMRVAETVAENTEHELAS